MADKSAQHESIQKLPREEQERLSRAEAPDGCKVLPDITVYEDANYGGDSWRTSLGYSYVGDDWNDRISSFIVHSGYFQFYADSDFRNPEGGLIGPGYYPWVADLGIINDTISSWRAYCE